jgi:hypothetical protein
MEHKRKFRKRLYRAQKGKCFYCGGHMNEFPNTKLSATLEHIIPLREGGLDDPTNLAVACKICNEWKGHVERILIIYVPATVWREHAKVMKKSLNNLDVVVERFVGWLMIHSEHIPEIRPTESMRWQRLEENIKPLAVDTLRRRYPLPDKK